jgi:outer membrane protein OmpA-like peptidoglycan-associated protein
MRQAVGIGLLLPAFVLVATGCATKKFVRELVSQKEAEMGQRVGTVEGRMGTEAQRLDKETARIDKVETGVADHTQKIDGLGMKVAEAGETAKAAGSRADTAFNKAEEVDSRLTRVWSKRNQRNLVETVDVQFAFNRADLTDAAQTALLAVIKELQQNPNLTIDLQGFTDSTGPRDYNVGLSQRRVEAVRRYLVEQGLELPRINAVGLGPVSGKGSREEMAKNRKVSVKLMVASE